MLNLTSSIGITLAKDLKIKYKWEQLKTIGNERDILCTPLSMGEVLLKCVDVVGLTSALASGVVLVDSAPTSEKKDLLPIQDMPKPRMISAYD